VIIIFDLIENVQYKLQTNLIQISIFFENIFHKQI